MLDPCCAFWPAGNPELAKTCPSPLTNSVSPLIDKKPAEESAKDEVEEETYERGKGREVEAKGRKEDEDQGPRGRKGENLEVDKDAGRLPKGRRIAETAAETKTPAEEAEELPPVPEAGEFEVRKHKVGRRPILPTKAEIEEHYPLHLNYRSWCSHCVAGKARWSQHKKSEDDKERLGVTWNMDYAFMGGEYNEDEEGMQPTLVLYDDDKDSFWAVGIDRKGVTEAMVKYCVGTLEQSGYNGEKLTIKYDQEPSMIVLKSATATARVGETVPIESPVRASKSNGMMENAIKIWQGQLRTIKH